MKNELINTEYLIEIERSGASEDGIQKLKRFFGILNNISNIGAEAREVWASISSEDQYKFKKKMSPYDKNIINRIEMAIEGRLIDPLIMSNDRVGRAYLPKLSINEQERIVKEGVEIVIVNDEQKLQSKTVPYKEIPPKIIPQVFEKNGVNITLLNRKQQEARLRSDISKKKTAPKKDQFMKKDEFKIVSIKGQEPRVSLAIKYVRESFTIPELESLLEDIKTSIKRM